MCFLLFDDKIKIFLIPKLRISFILFLYEWVKDVMVFVIIFFNGTFLGLEVPLEFVRYVLHFNVMR